MAKPEFTAYPSEHAEQTAVASWLRRRKIRFFAVPNGAKMGAREAAKMKKEGLETGVWDIVIISRANNGKHTVLEMKRREGGRLSPSQKIWGKVFSEEGWNTIVGYGAEDTIDKLIGLGYHLYGGNGDER